jgi:hypothetical protein
MIGSELAVLNAIADDDLGGRKVVGESRQGRFKRKVSLHREWSLAG